MEGDRASILIVAAVMMVGCAGSGTESGAELAANVGCRSCHAETDTALAPTWQGLAGSTVQLEDGSTVVADADYIRRSITDPDAQVVEGYRPAMPVIDLTDEEIDLLVEHIQGLGE